MSNKDKNQKKPSTNNFFREMEKSILEFWNKSKTFEKSVEKEAPQGDYTFYDGPPFATGLPHYGHIVASVMKDAIPRYWTMKGYRVKRKWGWDCHGLPVENLAEKELGLKNKQDIEEMGVEKFNEYCESIVMRYADEWKKIIPRLGRWVDMENDYKTMDVEYMESIWWVFKSLWEKDLIYKGHKSMHICPRCGTTLSNFEVNQGYKDIKDLSVTAKFELIDEPNTFVLAWTTTPWTLPGNVALAVGENIDYVQIKFKDRNYILAKDIFNSWKDKTKSFWEVFNTDGEIIIDKVDSEKMRFCHDSEIVKEFKGSELVGKKYKPLFDYYQDKEVEHKENAWQIYTGDFVTTEDGTGIVHIAPAFGEDDLNLAQKNNLPFIQHVDANGKFTEDVLDFAGMEVKAKDNHQATDIEIIKYLAHKNLLFSKEKYEHSYPHCWRCETPLLNYATDSWFVNIEKIKENLINNNKKVNWTPEHIKEGRFGKWLENARDWAISRNRYWGAPLPVWICESCGEIKVIGSRKELEELSGKEVKDLHKQYVDKIEIACEKCPGKMKKIPEVLDCWFESGSMPYAQNHYLGEALPDFDPLTGKNYPAEFIAEGMDQTRGWFYTLMVLSTALFEKEAFQNVIVNGIVLAEDGQKMSKSKQNYPDPTLIFDKYSADSLRYYLLSSPVLMGENLNFSEDGVKEVLRKVSMLLLNVYKFYEMFASSSTEATADTSTFAKATADTSDNILDQWILARLNELKKEVTDNMDNYNLPKAVRPVEAFISDFSTWYIRRSRDRFKGDDKQDKQFALQTTEYVLIELSKVMAPFTPFIAENFWQKVSGYDFSDENKSVHLEKWPVAEEVDKKIIEEMDVVRKVVELGLAKRDEAGIKVRQPLGQLRIKNLELRIDRYFELIKDEVNVKTVDIAPENTSKELAVELDTEITEELKQEGVKREIVRFVNAMRKNAGLTIQDRINLCWQSESEAIKKVFAEFEDEIKKDVLAESISNEDSESDNKKEVKINGDSLMLIIK